MTSILVENFNGYNANISWLSSEEQIGKPIRSGAHELEIGDGKKVGFKKGPLPNKTADDTIENLQNAIKTGNILTALPIANEGGKLANEKNSATETIVEENTKRNHQEEEVSGDGSVALHKYENPATDEIVKHSNSFVGGLHSHKMHFVIYDPNTHNITKIDHEDESVRLEKEKKKQERRAKHEAEKEMKMAEKEKNEIERDEQKLQQEQNHVHGGVVYQKHEEMPNQEGVPMPMSKTAMHHFKSLEEYKRHKEEEHELRKIEKGEDESEAKNKSHDEKIAEREERRRIHEAEKLEKERLKLYKQKKNKEASRELRFEENFKSPNMNA